MNSMALVTLTILLLLQANNLYAQDTERSQKEGDELLETIFKQYDELADLLESCETVTQEFIHPFTGKPMERKIVEVAGDDCLYIEQMPNNGKMECKYSEDSRKAIARYYRDMANGEGMGTKVKVSLSADGKQEVEAKYTIDGKEVENPLQEALDNGTCTISGY